MAPPVIFGFVVWLFAHESGSVSKVLMTRPFVDLVRRSYSIYLIHWFILSIISLVDKIMQVVMAKQSVPNFIVRAPWLDGLLELILS